MAFGASSGFSGFSLALDLGVVLGSELRKFFCAAANLLALSRMASRISDYQDYLDYEEMLMEVIDEVPLDWEFSKWVESARKQKVEKGR